MRLVLQGLEVHLLEGPLAQLLQASPLLQRHTDPIDVLHEQSDSVPQLATSASGI